MNSQPKPPRRLFLHLRDGLNMAKVDLSQSESKLLEIPSARSQAVSSSKLGSSLLASFCVFFLFLVLVPALKAQPPATVLLLRHAEKLTDGRVDLSSEGFARAKDLPQLFLGPRALFPRPDALFATHLSKHSNRPFETIEPLSKALNLTVDTTYIDGDYASLAKLLLSGEYAGKIVLVAWHHGTLPQFAAALGIDPLPAPWPATQFDRIWRIDWPQGGSAKPTLKDLPQQLMPGDSK